MLYVPAIRILATKSSCLFLDCMTDSVSILNKIKKLVSPVMFLLIHLFKSLC